MDSLTLLNFEATRVHPPKNTLSHGKNDRMAGVVPQWQTHTEPLTDTPQSAIEKNLSQAQQNINNATNAAPNALAYSPQATEAPPQKEFSFGDLVDIVNPLHHVPIVGHAYRAITKDEIGPMGQIIGGAVYGGPIGAASGLVNVVVQQETGKDLAGNALSFVRGEKTNYKRKSFNSKLAQADNYSDQYVRKSYSKTANTAFARTRATLQPPQDLANSLLAFSDLKHGEGFIAQKTGSKRIYNA